jgi:hypothetical protein
MKKHILLLLACLGMAACDDFMLTDGRTIARGYVTDSLTGQPVPGAKLLLFTCNTSVIFFGDRCRTILDSAVTDANGYYQFKFRDQRRTNYAVGISIYQKGDAFVPLDIYAQSNPDADIVDEELYRVTEGKKNQFNFLVKSLKTVRADLRITPSAYERFIITSRYDRIDFKAPAMPRDTTVYLKAFPLEAIRVYGIPEDNSFSQLLLEKRVPPDDVDIIPMELAF